MNAIDGIIETIVKRTDSLVSTFLMSSVVCLLSIVLLAVATTSIS